MKIEDILRLHSLQNHRFGDYALLFRLDVPAEKIENIQHTVYIRRMIPGRLRLYRFPICASQWIIIR